MPEIVYVRNISNSRVHKAFREEGSPRIATFEGCDLDDAAHLAILSDVEFTEVEPDMLCVRCFGTSE